MAPDSSPATKPGAGCQLGALERGVLSSTALAVHAGAVQPGNGGRRRVHGERGRERHIPAAARGRGRAQAGALRAGQARAAELHRARLADRQCAPARRCRLQAARLCEQGASSGQERWSTALVHRLCRTMRIVHTVFLARLHAGFLLGVNRVACNTTHAASACRLLLHRPACLDSR